MEQGKMSLWTGAGKYPGDNRKEIYLALHPETAKGKAGGRPKKTSVNSTEVSVPGYPRRNAVALANIMMLKRRASAFALSGECSKAVSRSLAKARNQSVIGRLIVYTLIRTFLLGTR
jgi:hypothetical protein